MIGEFGVFIVGLLGKDGFDGGLGLCCMWWMMVCVVILLFVDGMGSRMVCGDYLVVMCW